ncbi:MAG: TRAP transporter large permease [Alphaproteobacteria bacterium]
MSNVEIGLAMIVAMLFLVQSGLHVATSLLLLSFIGVWGIRGSLDVAGNILALSAFESISYYEFGVIPLFIVMGLLVSASGIGRDTFDVAAQIFRRVRGGLGMATVLANAMFAAINGTSIASASVFTRIAVPELIRLGYTPRFAVGVVAGSSVLGMLIPPSLLLILFGIIAEISIGALFTAGILPGILLSVAFAATISLLVILVPRFVTVDGQFRRDDELRLDFVTVLRKIAPIVGLIGLVLGGIYGGVFTPVEAGGVGALGALLVSALKGRLTPRMLWGVLVETGHVTASIAFLLIAAHLYANMLALSGLPDAMGAWLGANALSLPAMLAVYLVVIVLLGTILDAASIMLILLPLVLPVAATFGLDMVWFGVVTVIAVEIGLLTPPLGIACFVIKANLRDEGISLNDIFIGATPFAITMVIVLALVVAVPWFALALV